MAGKFVFRFQPILGLKEKEEDAKRAELGMVTKRLTSEKEILQNLHMEKEQVISQMKEKTKGIVQIKDFQRFAEKRAFLNDQIDKQRVTVDKWENKVAHSRKLLIEAKKQTKIYGVLKEKDYEEYKYMQMKEEEALVDQIVSFKSAKAPYK